MPNFIALAGLAIAFSNAKKTKDRLVVIHYRVFGIKMLWFYTRFAWGEA